MAVRAKFKVNSVTEMEGGLKTATLHPVYGDSEENKRFFKATPSGQIQLGTINAEAAKQFVPGREFYVDFTACGAQQDEKPAPLPSILPPHGEDEVGVDGKPFVRAGSRADTPIGQAYKDARKRDDENMK